MSKDINENESQFTTKEMHFQNAVREEFADGVGIIFGMPFSKLKLYSTDIIEKQNGEKVESRNIKGIFVLPTNTLLEMAANIFTNTKLNEEALNNHIDTYKAQMQSIIDQVDIKK